MSYFLGIFGWIVCCLKWYYIVKRLFCVDWIGMVYFLGIIYLDFFHFVSSWLDGAREPFGVEARVDERLE